MKILIAVDDSIGTQSSFSVSCDMCLSMKPGSVSLIFVEKYEGKSLIDEMLGDAEMATLKQVLEGTEYKEALDRKAQSLVGYYRKSLENKGVVNISTIIKEGHPAEEILRAAKEINADIIFIGAQGSRQPHLFMGSVSREVADRSEIPVLIVR